MITSTVKRIFNEGIQATYDWVVDAETPIKMVNAWGPMSGFKSYELKTGTWDKAGDYRTATLDDGSTLTETLTTLTSPTYFDYELSGFSNPALRMLVSHGRGVWHFKEMGPNRTHVTWTYGFEPRNRLVAPFVWAFMRLVYHPFMMAAFDDMERIQRSDGFGLPNGSVQIPANR
jgi:hypothetical protein